MIYRRNAKGPTESRFQLAFGDDGTFLLYPSNPVMVPDRPSLELRTRSHLPRGGGGFWLRLGRFRGLGLDYFERANFGLAG